MPRITAAICTYDRYPLLEQAIESLRGQTLPASDFRILIVDNSPDHAVARRFGERYDGVLNLTYLVEEMPGLSNARNVAIRACDSEFIAFMDDDAIAEPGWLAAILGAFETGANVVGGRAIPIWESPRPTWLADNLLGYLSLVDLGGELRETPDVDWIACCNMALRVSALPADSFAVALGRRGNAGPLLSNEELHLVRQIKADGGRVVYAPDAAVRHLVPADRLAREWFRRRSAWQAASDMIASPTEAMTKARSYRPKLAKLLGPKPWQASALKRVAAETDDPAVFEREIWTVYQLTVSLLAGIEDV